jgi:hypothetical protein
MTQRTSNTRPYHEMDDADALLDWAHQSYARNRGLKMKPGTAFYITPDGDVGSTLTPVSTSQVD